MPPPTVFARAVIVAGVLSGIPSTLQAVITHRSVLASTRAAGTLLGRPTVPRGLVAHAVVSAWWTGVLATVLPRSRTAAWGAVAGLGIGLVDLGVVARRRFPAIADLPRWPQLADHVGFGALVGAMLGKGRFAADGARR